jgi:hypothetical protein
MKWGYTMGVDFRERGMGCEANLILFLCVYRIAKQRSLICPAGTTKDSAWWKKNSCQDKRFELSSWGVLLT